jgi:hypothetical protein
MVRARWATASEWNCAVMNRSRPSSRAEIRDGDGAVPIVAPRHEARLEEVGQRGGERAGIDRIPVAVDVVEGGGVAGQRPRITGLAFDLDLGKRDGLPFQQGTT